MKQRFKLFRRGEVFYCEDTETCKQLSLHTKDEAEARALDAAPPACLSALPWPPIQNHPLHILTWKRP